MVELCRESQFCRPNQACYASSFDIAIQQSATVWTLKDTRHMEMTLKETKGHYLDTIGHTIFGA